MTPRWHWLRYLVFLGLMLLVFASADQDARVIPGLMCLLGLFIFEWAVMQRARIKLLKQLAQRNEENKQLRESLRRAAEDFMTVAEHMWKIRMGKATEVERSQDWVRTHATFAFLLCIKLLDEQAVQDALTSLGRLKDPNPIRDVLEGEVVRIIESNAPWRDVLLRFLHNGNYPREVPPPLPPRAELT